MTTAWVSLNFQNEILKDGKNSKGTKSVTIPINRKLNHWTYGSIH